MTVTIYHNNRCSTSRGVLAILREQGHEPVIIEYIKTPPTREQMVALLVAMDIPPRALLRAKEAIYKTLDLDNPAHSDRELLDAMLEHPELIQRPIVITAKGALLARPKERVLDIL